MFIGHFAASFLAIYIIDNNRLPVIHKIDDFQINMSKTLHKNGLV